MPEHYSPAPLQTLVVWTLRAYPVRGADAGSFLTDLLPHTKPTRQAGRWRVAMGRGRRGRRRPTIWRIPDELWVLVKATLPAREFLPSGGRPWLPPRQIVDGVL